MVKSGEIDDRLNMPKCFPGDATDALAAHVACTLKTPS